MTTMKMAPSLGLRPKQIADLANSLHEDTYQLKELSPPRRPPSCSSPKELGMGNDDDDDGGGNAPPVDVAGQWRLVDSRRRDGGGRLTLRTV